MFYLSNLSFSLICAALIIVPDAFCSFVDKSGPQSIQIKQPGESPLVQMYYESMCPVSRFYYKTQFLTAVRALKDLVEFETNPYGNSGTYVKNGSITFKCQHGPEECYGNKLHACAIDELKNITRYAELISCLMDPLRNNSSDDVTTDECGKKLHLNPEPIKKCAKSDRATQLLKVYGDDRNAANIPGVPWIMINGSHESWRSNLIDKVCSQFHDKPKSCKDKELQDKLRKSRQLSNKKTVRKSVNSTKKSSK